MLKSQRLDMPYFEISAKEGLNIENVSYILPRLLLILSSIHCDDTQYRVSIGA